MTSKNTKLWVLILSALSALCQIICLFKNIVVLRVIGYVLAVAAAIISLLFFAKTNKVAKEMVPLHFSILTCIFTALACIIAKDANMPSVKILATTATIMLIALFTYIISNNLIVSIIVGLLTIIFVACDLHVAFYVFVALAAVVSIVFALIKKNFKYLVTSLLTTIFAIISIVKFKAIYPNDINVYACLGFVLAFILTALAFKDNEVVTKEMPKQNTQDDESSDEEKMAKWVDKAYRSLSYAELLNAPVEALTGVSDTDAALLKSAFGIKTIGDFATNKYFTWAREIVEEANS